MAPPAPPGVTVSIEPFQERHLDGVTTLARAEGWHTYADSERLHRALTAPGVTALVAVEGSGVVGFIQLQSDGVIQAHLSAIVVAADRRGCGIGRHLVQEALAAAGGERIDLVVSNEAVGFYRSFVHKELMGFRLYSDPT